MSERYPNYRRWPNEYAIVGDLGLIFLDRRDDTQLICLVDATDVERCIGFPYKWSGHWSEEAQTFYVSTRSGITLHRRLRKRAKVTSSTPHKGVYRRDATGLYRVQVSVNGRRQELPFTFESADDAADAMARFERGVATLIESFSERESGTGWNTGKVFRAVTV